MRRSRFQSAMFERPFVAPGWRIDWEGGRAARGIAVPARRGEELRATAVPECCFGSKIQFRAQISARRLEACTCERLTGPARASKISSWLNLSRPHRIGCPPPTLILRGKLSKIQPIT